MTADLDLDALAALEQAHDGTDPRATGDLVRALLDAAPALIAAARERDALADDIEDHWRGEVTILAHQRDAARAELADLRGRLGVVEDMAERADRKGYDLEAYEVLAALGIGGGA
jgi:hypothetical protein